MEGIPVEITIADTSYTIIREAASMEEASSITGMKSASSR
jgi:hypothetical protein